MTDIIQTEVLNTEEVLRRIQNFNNSVEEVIENVRVMPNRGNKIPSIQSKSIIVGSMDVTGLYPNCKKASTMRNVEDAINQSTLEFESTEKKFLTRFVGVIT